MPTHQATLGTNPQTTQARCSERSRPQAVTPDGDSESFDFANISDSEEEEDQPPARRPSTQPTVPTQTTIPRTDSGINDPNIVASASAKNKAHDVHYFYDKLPLPAPNDIYQCKFCK